MTEAPLSPEQAAVLVEWYAAMGVDVALSETPRNRMAPASEEVVARPVPAPLPEASLADPDESEWLGRMGPADFPTFDDAPEVRRNPPGPTATITPTAAPSEETTRAAREMAQAAATLADLRAVLDRFEGCNLRVTATRLVFADGNPESRVMFVGEAPGRDEDMQGLPFVGRSGQLLDRMLAAIGLDRNSVYVANVIPWRPPGNRDPAPHEVAICLPFIKRQIELVDPDFLVLLGKASAHTLLETSDGILRLRGRWREYDTGTRRIRAMATLHPAYLLRQPLQKRLAWRDFLALKTAMEAAPNA